MDFNPLETRRPRSPVKNCEAGGSVAPFAARLGRIPPARVSSRSPEPEQHRRAWLGLYGLGGLVGLYLTTTVPDGWFILALGGSMGLLSLFYTYPPLKLQYHGFGEVLVGVIFGPVIMFGSYFVQARRLDVVPLVASVPFGLFVAAFLLVNEMPEWRSDPKGGKVTVPARVGLESSMKIYTALMVAGYAWLAGAVALRFLPPLALLGLASLPLGVKAIRILRKDFASFPKHIGANAATLQSVLVSGIGLAAAFVVPVFVALPF